MLRYSQLSVIALCLFSISGQSFALAPKTDLDEFEDYKIRMEKVLGRTFFANKEQSLTQDQIKSGREKFDVRGNVLPFYGVSSISWIEKGSALFKKLDEVQSELINQVNKLIPRPGGEVTIAPVAPDSFHMTICDLIVGDKIGDRNGAVDLTMAQYSQIARYVEAAFRELPALGSIDFEVRGIGGFSTCS